MTGLLDMGDNKLTNLGDPENDKDAVNKKYVDTFLEQHERDLDVIGRYLVISKNGDKNYVSLRTKKNIDLQQDMLVNITSEGIINTGNLHQYIPINNLPNGNKLGIMQLHDQLDIYTQIQSGPGKVIDLSQPWTFLFSAKPNLSLGINRSYLRFGQQ